MFLEGQTLLIRSRNSYSVFCGPWNQPQYLIIYLHLLGCSLQPERRKHRKNHKQHNPHGHALIPTVFQKYLEKFSLCSQTAALNSQPLSLPVGITHNHKDHAGKGCRAKEIYSWFSITNHRANRNVQLEWTNQRKGLGQEKEVWSFIYWYCICPCYFLPFHSLLTRPQFTICFMDLSGIIINLFFLSCRCLILKLDYGESPKR